VRPEEPGLARHPVEALRGGGPEENAAWLRDLLAGRASGAHADAVALNAGALAWVAGRAESLADGAAAGRAVLAAGSAIRRLERFVEITHDA
jgi:anthranilate phosphoribosyltransferase